MDDWRKREKLKPCLQYNPFGTIPNTEVGMHHPSFNPMAGSLEAATGEQDPGPALQEHGQ